MRSQSQTARLRVEHLEDRTLMSTCHVTRLNDTGVGMGFRGDLRYCINKVNAEPGPDVIDFTLTGTVELTSQLPDLASAISIQGPGQSLLTIDANQTGRGFTVTSGSNVEIANLTVRNGFHVAAPIAGGAGIYNAGNLTLAYATITGNFVATKNNGLTAYAGGIWNVGTLTLFESSVTNNTSYAFTLTGGADARGGGITNFGIATIVRSTIDGNAATTSKTVHFEAYGGGIYNSGALLVDSSVISNNVAGTEAFDAFGGGIASVTGSFTIQNSTVVSNRAAGFKYGDGGGIYMGTGTIRHSTIAGNLSTGDLSSEGGGIRIVASATLQNTIIAANWAGTGGPDVFGVLDLSGHNLIGDPSGGSGYAASDLLAVDPLLGPLGDYGGPTLTYNLLPGSPAIDAGDNTDAPEFDQRGPGFPRIVNATIDIGAFEVQATGAPNSHGHFAVLVSPVSEALKGRDMPAQGNALGNEASIVLALKGRNQDAGESFANVAPLQGLTNRVAKQPRALPWACILRPVGAEADSEIFS